MCSQHPAANQWVPHSKFWPIDVIPKRNQSRRKILTGIIQGWYLEVNSRNEVTNITRNKVKETLIHVKLTPTLTKKNLKESLQNLLQLSSKFTVQAIIKIYKTWEVWEDRRLMWFTLISGETWTGAPREAMIVDESFGYRKWERTTVATSRFKPLMRMERWINKN